MSTELLLRFFAPFNNWLRAEGLKPGNEEGVEEGIGWDNTWVPLTPPAAADASTVSQPAADVTPDGNVTC